MNFSKQKNILRKNLESLGISDQNVLAAIENVPREQFVSSDLETMSYTNLDISLNKDQILYQPYITAFMCEAAQITTSDIVLEIGTGTGYQTSVIAQLCKQVFSVELIPELGNHAFQKIKELGYNNIHIDIASGLKRHKSRKKFDAIIVTTAPSEVPEILISQLKINGRLIVPTKTGEIQELFRIIKTKHGIVRESFFNVNFVPMLDDK
ncbi:MAG: protein-L-isoaspartate(D-aspartate) O-methyltransferase [Rickettsiales bacterium]|nr:protein-L-isoaspartate(D-aspartate) O-methyltransferase [Rickettsiales bacterium]